ncbi:MAG: transposase [Bacteroidota bacterium]
MSGFLHPHRKRFYEPEATYFITSVTHRRCRFFIEPILAELFVQDLWFAVELKQLDLYGYTVLPNHVHLLFEPLGEPNCSEIMRSLKTNFSRDANDILLGRMDHLPKQSAGDVVPAQLGGDVAPMQPAGDVAPMQPAGDVAPRPLRRYEEHWINTVPPLYRRFIQNNRSNLKNKPFRWQKSFHDHIIRDERDYDNHLEYIYENAVRHHLVIEPEDYPWMWIEGMSVPSLTSK